MRRNHRTKTAHPLSVVENETESYLAQRPRGVASVQKMSHEIPNCSHDHPNCCDALCLCCSKSHGPCLDRCRGVEIENPHANESKSDQELWQFETDLDHMADLLKDELMNLTERGEAVFLTRQPEQHSEP